ncbi:hypothetical protein PA905_29730 [Planktothrix agardhii CCAP 1459/11A]|uniref:DUF1822 domain-containing protein n=1 Tax=Planktothrix agardhii CCAP 1459/11A TaxID=282420 RepID=A0A4P5ZFN0_PLAAG|nr:DUF1822 family protein [Planktothrix agardhii]GDZ94936.1 hypothetical protein PA905_29730 [Planktothrix agardhii CCAP 1459/11A]
MKTQLELTRTFYPEQLYIELSEQQMINAWNQANKHFQNDIIRWRAYLNYLVVEAIPKIETELDLEKKLGYYPSDLSKVLEFINGTILTLGETRLVVIPSDSNIGGDLCVPQELVDLPQFAGDYYLGVYINLDEEWLRFWGACSHKKLTTEGVYDESSRNYYLDRDELIEDLEAVLIAREICPNERGEYKFVNLPSLSESESNGLWEQLKQPDCYVPRLALDSPTWLSLFINDLVVASNNDPITAGIEFLDSDDPVAVQVREMLKNRSILEIVAQFNTAYGNNSATRLPYALVDILAGSTPTAQNKNMRSASEGSENIKLLTLARNLAKKLAEIWAEE